MTTQQKTCTDNTPRWFVGHWRDWHRGHGCSQDDGKPRTDAAKAEIAQHGANKGPGYLTDAELGFLRASTTSGNEMLVRALDELKDRRNAKKKRAVASFDHSARTTMLTASMSDRKIRAMMLNESVDHCRGVVQCALEGCQNYMAVVEPGTPRSSGNVEDLTPNAQVAWFLEHHECRGTSAPAPRKKARH